MNADSPAPRAGGLQPSSGLPFSDRSADRKSSGRAFGFLLAAACLLAACAVRHASAPRLPNVGVARVDITPDYSIRLTGFAARKTESEGVAQRIHAKALAIGTDAEGPAVLVTVDNLGVSDAIRTELLRRLANTRLTHDRLAICSSHTHSAPMIVGVAPNKPKRGQKGVSPEWRLVKEKAPVYWVFCPFSAFFAQRQRRHSKSAFEKPQQTLAVSKLSFGQSRFVPTALPPVFIGFPP